MDLKQLTAETFQPHVGTVFHFDVGNDQKIDLTLTEVKVQMQKHLSSRLHRDSFSLYFSGPQNLYIQQGMYESTHDALGSLPLFIVPMERKPDGSFEFEAVFT